VFMKTGAEGSSGLSRVLHVTCGAGDFVNPGVLVVVFVLVGVTFFRQQFFSVFLWNK
jgi:hypothetical protein